MKPTSKNDGFYQNASKILHSKPLSSTIRMSVNSGIIKKPIESPMVPIERFKCISCDEVHNVFERNIRGRILKGYLVVKDNRTTIQKYPEPGKRPHPTYYNGRLCEGCFPNYTTQAANPTDYKSIQLIKDVQPPTKRGAVTLAQVEDEDKDQEKALEQARLDARPKWNGIPINVGKVESLEKQRYVCTNLKCNKHNGENTLRCSSCGAYVEVEKLTIDTNAFRKFMQARGKRVGTGRKDYEARLVGKIDAHNEGDLYDEEVNYSNIKKG